MAAAAAAVVGAVVATLAVLQSREASFVPGPQFAGRGARDLHGCVRAAEGTATLTRKDAEELSAEDEETLRVISVTLLQRIGGAEEILLEADGKDGDQEIDLEEFQDMLVKLELECTKDQSTRIFKMMDTDGSGTLCIGELRTKLRESDAITQMYSESLQNVGLTVVGAALVAGGLAFYKGPSAGLDFATAYIVEDSLSVDNLFVFLLLFKYFQVPPALQTFCLNLGIYGAVILRGAFIFVGLAAIKAFEPLLLFFAAFLLYASYQALAGGDEDEDEDEKPPEFVEQLSRVLPTTAKFDGDKLFVKGADGGWLATPLALCIIAVELSDILFAVDSIPAVFAVTDDPVIVFTSNIAAILGLRSLYQVLSVAVQDLIYLEKAVAVVLGFVGLKLGLEVFHFEISSLLSLAVILGILGLGVGLSLYDQNKGEYDKKLAKQPTILKLLQGVRKLLG